MKTVHFNLDILSQHVAVMGKTGSGKTYAAKGGVELLLKAGHRVCIIDPTGAWWGLKSSADGKGEGYPVVIFGGDHADVPITEHAAEAVARLVAEGNRPCVIDLSNFRIGERHRFVERFAEAVFTLNKAPLHLILDEADEFAPQSGAPGTERMLGAVDRIVRRGRIKGFRVMLITQRPAVLNKNVLTQANAVVAMRLPAPQDRKAIEAWIKGQADEDQAADVLASLAKLQKGEGWLWAPEQDVLTRGTFPRISTFDSSRTPDAGEQPPMPTGWAEVDLGEVSAQMAEAVKEAEANDPKRLKARIAELEAQAAAAPPQVAEPAPDLLREEYDRGYAEGQQAVAYKANAEFDTIIGFIREVTQAADVATKTLSTVQTRANAIESHVLPLFNQFPGRFYTENQPDQHTPQKPGAGNTGRAVMPAPASVERKTGAVHANGVDKMARAHARGMPPGSPPGESAPGGGGKGLARAEKAILTVLAQRRAPVAKATIAVAAGYAVGGGGFNNALSALRSKGWVDGLDPMSITPDGSKALGRVDPLPRGDALRRWWMDHAQIGKAERSVLEVLAGGRRLTKEETAERSGYAADGGGFNNALSRLRTLGLIEGKGELRLTQELIG